MAITKGKVTKEQIYQNDKTWLRLADGESVQLAIIGGLDAMLSYHQHTFWGKDNDTVNFVCVAGDGLKCPGCDLDNDPIWRGFVPVFVKGQGFAVWSLSATVYKNLEQLQKMIGDLDGRILGLSRTGTGRQTEYHTTNLGGKVNTSKVVMPEWETWLATEDMTEIWAMLEEAAETNKELIGLSALNKDDYFNQTPNKQVDIFGLTEDSEEEEADDWDAV